MSRCKFQKTVEPDGWIELLCEAGDLCRNCPDSDRTEKPKEEKLPFRMIAPNEFRK